MAFGQVAGAAFHPPDSASEGETEVKSTSRFLHQLGRLLALPLADKLLLAAAVLLRMPIAVGLRLAPFRFWQPLLARSALQGSSVRTRRPCGN